MPQPEFFQENQKYILPPFPYTPEELQTQFDVDPVYRRLQHVLSQENLSSHAREILSPLFNKRKEEIILGIVYKGYRAVFDIKELDKPFKKGEPIHGLWTERSFVEDYDFQLRITDIHSQQEAVSGIVELSEHTMISFYGNTAEEAVKEFHNSVDDYLDWMQDENEAPEIPIP